MMLKQIYSLVNPKSARCVQRFDDSQCSAIHTTFRASLRSSSMREPRDPLLKVLILDNTFRLQTDFGHKYGVGTPKHGFASTELKGRRYMTFR